jgi:hypothetical protein
VRIIQRDFAPDYASIPPHGRWQHFNVGGKDRIEELSKSWPRDTDTSERCRRYLDLFLVSVLLDAGAGNSWSYKSNENGRTYRRSEGLAIASLEMFKAGKFSSNQQQPHQVDGEGLRSLTVEDMRAGLQVTMDNPIAGLEGRTELLQKLSEAMMNHTYFGADGRPGNMLGEQSRSWCNIYTNSTRLSHLTPYHTSFVSPYCTFTYPLECPYGRTRPNLAFFTNCD